MGQARQWLVWPFVVAILLTVAVFGALGLLVWQKKPAGTTASKAAAAETGFTPDDFEATKRWALAGSQRLQEVALTGNQLLVDQEAAKILAGAHAGKPIRWAIPCLSVDPPFVTIELEWKGKDFRRINPREPDVPDNHLDYCYLAIGFRRDPKEKNPQFPIGAFNCLRIGPEVPLAIAQAARKGERLVLAATIRSVEVNQDLGFGVILDNLRITALESSR